MELLLSLSSLDKVGVVNISRQQKKKCGVDVSDLVTHCPCHSYFLYVGSNY